MLVWPVVALYQRCPDGCHLLWGGVVRLLHERAEVQEAGFLKALLLRLLPVKHMIVMLIHHEISLCKVCKYAAVMFVGYR